MRAYHAHLTHFLAWTEFKNSEADSQERFNFKKITNYRVSTSSSLGSLEVYESDMKDKNLPALRTKSPSTIKTRIAVANAFIAFCIALGYRNTTFSPYISTVNKAYLDRNEIFTVTKQIPEIEELAEFVQGHARLRDRVAAGLIIFGGLRVTDMLSMTIGDVPKILRVQRTGHYRVELQVLGKGSKLRITTIPEWVYNDLSMLATLERDKLRKKLQRRGQRLPMGKDAYVFVNTQNSRNFGKRMSSKFLRNIFSQSPLRHPHAGRHAFACWRMLELIAMRSFQLRQAPMTALLEAGLHQDTMATLQSEMGHERLETTEIYLNWVRRRILDGYDLVRTLRRIEAVNVGR